MSEPTTHASLSSSFGTLLDRVGDFFHIFDLSYFVGGTLTLAAVAFAYLHLVYVGLATHYPLPDYPWLVVMIVVVGAYSCGLIAFAIGRSIGTYYRSDVLRDRLLQRIDFHGIRTCPALKTYIEELMDPKRTPKDVIEVRWCLYGRMWSEVAHEDKYPLLLHHLMRYWAMSATYDGVGFALLTWAGSIIVVVAASYRSGLYPYLAVAACLLLMSSGHFAFRQAARYFQYQLDDLAAHFAVKHGLECTHQE